MPAIIIICESQKNKVDWSIILIIKDKAIIYLLII